MTYFNTYSQDNCLLECRVKKIAKQCGCSPWFVPIDRSGLNQMDVEDDPLAQLPVCEAKGNECFAEKTKKYNDDLIDRTECDCKNDCEMVHIFSTLQVKLKLNV